MLPRFIWSLRAKLVLAALALLVIPWVGYKYVKAMEGLMRENQVQAVIATARAVAAALQDRPRRLELRDGGAADEAPVARPVAQEIELLTTGLARAGSRIWIIDSRLRLVAVAGNLDNAAHRRQLRHRSERSSAWCGRCCSPCLNRRAWRRLA